MLTRFVVYSILVLGAGAAVAGKISDSHPDGILCPVPARGDRAEGSAILYLSAVFADGRVVYQSLGTNVVSAAFSPSGEQDGNASSLCEGMSLADLVDAGLTFDF